VAAPTHLNSSSLPSLLSKDSDADKEREKEKEKEHEKREAREAEREKEREREKRLEELAKELEKEKEAKVKANSEKAALEAEIESLSQALFEEVCIVPYPIPFVSSHPISLPSSVIYNYIHIQSNTILTFPRLPFIPTGKQNGCPRTHKTRRDGG
jgi:hypothetical protein